MQDEEFEEVGSPKFSIVKIVIVVLIIAVVGMPLCYFLGHSDGYSKGWEKGQFRFYYVKPKEQKFGVYDLAETLGSGEWIKPYQEGVFDCSEMSAYLEWYLENRGWHTFIITGESPFSEEPHAWILVETSEGKYMPVETTTPKVVFSSSPYFDNYFEYEHKFETIQDALAVSETEFDWWRS